MVGDFESSFDLAIPNSLDCLKIFAGLQGYVLHELVMVLD